jgi:hypothetical protein
MKTVPTVHMLSDFFIDINIAIMIHDVRASDSGNISPASAFSGYRRRELNGLRE